MSVESNPGWHWFCLTTLCDWSRKLAPPSQPIRCKSKTNRNLVTRVFPRLRPVTVLYLLWVLIGSLWNFPLFWLAVMITLFLVLRHWIEKRSNSKKPSRICCTIFAKKLVLRDFKWYWIWRKKWMLCFFCCCFCFVFSFVVFFFFFIANEATEHRAIHENWRKILNFCVTDFFFPYLALSNTPYLGSDVTLLAFVPRLGSEPACSLLTILNQCVLSSIDTFLKDLRSKKRTDYCIHLIYYILYLIAQKLSVNASVA